MKYFNPPPAPMNVTDLRTGTRGLEQRRFRIFKNLKDDATTITWYYADDIAAPTGSAEVLIRNLVESEGVDAETILPKSGLKSLRAS